MLVEGRIKEEDHNGNELFEEIGSTTDAKGKKMTQILKGWDELPTVVLVEVFKNLPLISDRLSAASVCRTWRLPAFQVPLRDTLTLRMLKGEKDVPKILYLSEQFGRKVPFVEFTLDFGRNGEECLDCISQVFNNLEGNRELKSLIIHCSDWCLSHPLFDAGNEEDKRQLFFKKVLIPLNKVLQTKNKLEIFSFPLLQSMSSATGSNLLTSLLSCRNASSLSKLFLPTFKYFITEEDDNMSSTARGARFLPSLNNKGEILSTIPELIRTDIFVKLQMLSIGHDYLTDEILSRMGVGSAVGGLKRLNLIAFESNFKVSYKGWDTFLGNNSGCKVRLTITGGSGLVSSNSNLLFPNIPLTHLRTHHCKEISVNFLSLVVGWNFDTLEHLELVDDDCDWIETLMQLGHEEDQFIDPIVYAAWRCKKLHTIKIRLLYCGDSLVGIARLKGPSLHLLEIPKSHVVYNSLNFRQLNKEISSALERPWRPMNNSHELRTKYQRLYEEEAALIHTLRSSNADEL